MESGSIIQQLTTLRDYMRWGSSEFNRWGLTFGHGFGSSVDESVYLVLHTLELPWDFPVEYFDCVLTQVERERIVANIMKRIKTRKPVAYITQEAWFCGVPFYVDERVLVPRSPIAELINDHFEPWIDMANVSSILDLCTGSGCIAIGCQYAFPDARVCASDLSSDALEVAKINLKNHGMTGHISLYESNLFAQIPEQKFDLIVSNPPYVDAEDMASLADEFKAEPKLGLAGGEDGLTIVDRILEKAGEYLSDDGLLVVEVGHSQSAMMDKYNQLPLSWIEFEQGGTGVFCITKQELDKYFNNEKSE